MSQSGKPRPHQRELVARIGSERGQEVGTSVTFSPAAEDRAAPVQALWPGDGVA